MLEIRKGLVPISFAETILEPFYTSQLTPSIFTSGYTALLVIPPMKDLYLKSLAIGAEGITRFVDGGIDLYDGLLWELPVRRCSIGVDIPYITLFNASDVNKTVRGISLWLSKEK